MPENIDIPLMHNNITSEDRAALIEFLKEDVRLTQGDQVKAFEKEWSQWLGVRHSVFVNSGASANTLTMRVLRQLYGEGEVIVPPLTWVSDIASVLQAGFKPVFVDINPSHFGMDSRAVLRAITPKTRAVFLTHVLGFNGLDLELFLTLKEKNIALIEDVCESHGATFQNRRLGSFGFASNFSFYYAHHLSTIEGGMVCTDDDAFYEYARMGRSHGMVREATAKHIKSMYENNHPDLNPDFIFAMPAYNFRSTELNAVIGRNQLKRLDSNNEKRKANFKLFLSLLDPQLYRTNFNVEGSVNYAFTLVQQKPDEAFSKKLMQTMRDAGVEFRRGLSGGGNQMRQPYLKELIDPHSLSDFPNVEHVHFFGYYLGNYPDLSHDKIRSLCRLLNEVKA